MVSLLSKTIYTMYGVNMATYFGYSSTQAEYDAYDSSSTTSSALEVLGLEYGINLAIFNKGMMS